MFNTFTQLSSFVLVALLVGRIGDRLGVERELSRKDNLTSLPNRRAFYELAEVLMAGARRSKRPFTLAYLDLDDFKVVNDQHGHHQGDRALRRAADVIRSATRSSDVVARLGGDEFVVYLPDTDPDAAQPMLERLRESLSTRQDGWPITASIGAVSFLEPPATLEEAVHDVDALMFRAKRAGKNRVLIETGGTAEPPADAKPAE